MAIPMARAADGSGTATASPSAVLASSTGNTVTVVHTAAETMDSGEVSVTIPTGWTAPQGTNGSAGYTTVSSTGTLGKVEDVADSATGWSTGTACVSGAPSADTTIKHEGSASVSCANGNEAAGDVWHKAISSEDWSTYTTVGFWLYASGAITSGHLQFSYDNTASLASPLESISVGALSAATWTYVPLTFGATTRTAVISYGFRINNASGVDNKTIKVDDILLGPYSTPTFSSQDVKVRLLALADTQTVTVTYGSGGGASGATAPATLGAHTFTVKNRVSDSSSSLTSISSSPSVDVVPAATKVLVGLTGQTVNGSSITGSCPTPSGGTTVTIAGTPTATTAGTAINSCVYATDSSDKFASLATNNTTISSTPNDTQGTYPGAANLVSGKGSFSVTFKTATSYTVTATPASLTAGTSSSITINTDVTSKLVITTNPTSVNAGSETTAFVVTRRDQFDNATTTSTQTVNLSSTSTGANKQFRDSAGGAGVTSVTIGGGSSTEDFFYYDDKAGSWSIAVAFSGLTGDSKTLTVNAGATTILVITSNPSSVTAGSETTAYVVERRDQYANTVTSGTQTVNLSSTSGGANKQFRDSAGGAGVSSVTIGAGNSNEDFFYYDELAGSYTIAVAFGGLTGDSKALTVDVASVSKLVITSNPSSHTAGNETTGYVVQRRDQFDNPVTSGTQTVNLSSTSTGANKQFRDTAGGGGVSSVTIGAGNSTEDFFYYDEKAGSWSIAVAFGGLTGDSKSLTTNPAATSKLVITGNPSSVTAGSETTAYVVERRDQFDNITTTGAQTVNLTSTSTGSNKQFRDSAGGGGVSSVTISGGNSTEDFFYYDDLAGSWSVSVSFGGLTGDSKALTVNPATTTTLVITTNPSSVVAGSETTAFIVTRRDTFGNATTAGTQTVNLTSTSTGANKQFRDSAGGGGVSSITIADGNSTEDFFYYDDKSGSWSIAVAFSGLSGDSKTLTVIPATTTQLVITANPTSTTAGTETTAYVVERRDQYANVVTAGTQSVNLSSTSTGANKQFRDSAGGAGVSSIVIGAGNGTEDFYYYDEKSGSWSISVAFSGLTGDSKTLTVNVAATSNLVITSGPATVTAGNETTAFIVTRRDAFGNATMSGTQTVNLSSTSTGANKQFRDSSGGGSVGSVTIGAGSSTEDFFYYDDKSGSWAIVVSFSGLTGDSTTLTVNPAATNQLVITTSPTTMAAGSESSTYVVTRRDQFNNPTTSGSQTVNLSSTSLGSYQFRAVSGGAAVTSATIGAGSSTANFFYTDNLTGTVAIAVAASGLAGDSKSLTITAGTAPPPSGSSPPVTSVPPPTTSTVEPPPPTDSTITPQPPPTAEVAPMPEPTTESWWTKFVRWFYNTTTKIGEGLIAFGRTAQRVTSSLARHISLAAQSVATATSSFGTELKTSLQSGLKTTQQSVTYLNESITVVSQQVDKAFREASTEIGQGLTTLSRDAEVAVNNSAVALGTLVFRGANSIGSALASATKSVGKLFANAASQTGSAIASGAVVIGQAIENGATKIADSSKQIGNKITSAFGRIRLGVEKFAEVVFDRKPNLISNVQVVVKSPTEVSVSWQTNHLSTSKVNYGSAVGVYEHEQQSGDYTRDHQVALTNLTPGQQYFYEVLSQNGNLAVDAFRSFTTPAR